MTTQDNQSVQLQGDTKFQRINDRLVAEWERARGNNPFPLENEIEMKQLDPVWQHCFLVAYAPRDGHPYSYPYLGEALIAAYGGTSHEQEVCERLVYPPNPSLHHLFAEVIRAKVPVEQEDAFVNADGLQIRYRSVVLPLGAETYDNVAFILGGMRWKPFL